MAGLITRIDNAAVAVGAGAISIRAAEPGRFSWLITNNGPDVLYIGGASVTAADGTPVAAGGNVSGGSEAEIFGISAGNSDARVLVELR